MPAVAVGLLHRRLPPRRSSAADPNGSVRTFPVSAWVMTSATGAVEGTDLGVPVGVPVFGVVCAAVGVDPPVGDAVAPTVDAEEDGLAAVVTVAVAGPGNAVPGGAGVGAAAGVPWVQAARATSPAIATHRPVRLRAIRRPFCPHRPHPVTRTRDNPACTIRHG